MQAHELTASLRNAIEQMSENDRLPSRRTLCDQFNVTTFSLQQAFQILEREGLIVVLPRKGVFVKRHLSVDVNYLQMLYLDHPDLRLHDRGLEALSRLCQQWNISFRATHINCGNWEEFQQKLNQFADDPQCFGVTVSGYITEQAAAFLERRHQPIALLGDVISHKAWPTLPTVTANHFQGGLTIAHELIHQNCTRLLLIGFDENPAHYWTLQMHRGIIAGLERSPQVEVYTPKKKLLNLADISLLKKEVLQWLNEKGANTLGILCRQPHYLAIAGSLKQALNPASSHLATLGDELPQQGIQGVLSVGCTIDELAHACLSRLAAMRREADLRGPQLVTCKIRN